MTGLSDKVAIVTGAATGIGESIARRLFADGARLVLVGHGGRPLQDLARELDPGGDRALTVVGDVRDPECMRKAAALAEEAFGGLHIAVNNAGTPGPGGTLIEDLSLEDWETVIGTNLTGMFLSLKAELPLIARSGGGAVLNLSSANGIVGVAGLAAYTATKHGVIGLTRSAALEYADRNVRVNCIGPGYVATPRMSEMPAEALEALGSQHPLGRLATREEVAEFAAFLVSDRASFCTGGFYPVDGGYTAQ
ncbi:SDR family NAD(P)-dependent oxidoreductase [Chelativorans sp.]|uniref:SDR family NAD(P)-dependent oxidoreductase n=1 Tax=Chelativorans sp. TaxID=2203393 RepID=UPI0028114DD9|nr:SDR family NAD(P)-dependent oxidoreductase [Chelativorans sp.]